MKTSPDQLTGALTDVRKAYRLIHAYQQRVWDLLRTVDHDLAHAGLRFQRWMPMQYMSPPKSKTRFFVERWARDFLPAYHIGCEWQEEGTAAKPIRRVFIIVAADSGYDSTSEAEPDPSAFEPAEKSTTAIRVGLWTASIGTPNWGEAWEHLPSDAREREGETHTGIAKDVTYTYRFLRIDVADLVDDAAVQAKLLQPIKSWIVTKKP